MLPVLRNCNSSYSLANDTAVVELNVVVNWCFKPSQPQRIISGLKETLIERYIVERTSKAEMKPEEQSRKAESCLEVTIDRMTKVLLYNKYK